MDTKQKTLQAIADADFSAIVELHSQICDTERLALIDLLISKDTHNDDDFPETEKDVYAGLRYYCYNFALMTLVRDESDIERVQMPRTDIFGNVHTHNPFSILNTKYYPYILAFFDKVSPEPYIKEFIKTYYNHDHSWCCFSVVWYFYKKGWLKFDESVFVPKLLEIKMFERSVPDDVQFLLANPEAIEKVLLQLYRIEAKVLDLSKWESNDKNRKRNDTGAGKVTDYWDEVFELLVKNGYEIPRSFVSNLFESLLNPWKKPHLDWHCRLIDWLQPTTDEILANQNTLFAVLGVGNVSLINFAMNKISTICKDKNFDNQGFVDNFALTFTVAKATKSQLVGLGILEQIFAKNTPDDATLEQLAVLLMNPDAKLQEKTALLLKKFASENRLADIISPFTEFLKPKTKEILSISVQIDSKTDDFTPETNENRTFEPINYPKNTDELLFLIGDCIRTKSPADIDVLFESLNRFQKQLPTDFQKQIAPYQKQLNREWEIYTMPILQATLQGLVEKKNISVHYSEKEWTKLNKMPYGKEYDAYYKDLLTRRRLSYARENFSPLFHKAQLLVEKVISGDDLPFVSTPTHLPFYVSADALVDRLLEYEKANKIADLQDVILACNRLLPQINETAKQKAQNLSGTYAKAIQYYLDLTDTITLSDELLPLWTQITRLKHPNKDFTADFPEEIAKIPAVGKPLYLDYKVKERKNGAGYTFVELQIDKNWDGIRLENTRKPIYQLLYNANPFDTVTRSDIEYQLSLNPHYLDAFLLSYAPAFGTDNEVQEIERCEIPMRFIVENQLPIRHGGLLYVAACLVFQTKTSRELAGEFVLNAVNQGDDLTYLADAVAQILAKKHSPINRLIEFLDKPFASVAMKKFQLDLLERCILAIDTNDKLPTNAKKLVVYYENLCQELGEATKEEVVKYFSKK